MQIAGQSYRLKNKREAGSIKVAYETGWTTQKTYKNSLTPLRGAFAFGSSRSVRRHMPY